MDKKNKMDEKIKEKIWKKFKEQKKEELKEVGLCFLGMWGFAGMIGLLYEIMAICIKGTGIPFNLTIFLLSLFPVIFWIVYGVYYWLNSNWKRATEEVMRKEITGKFK